MQQINISLRILDGVNASVVDEYNQLQNWTASIVRGMNAELVLKLFSSTTQDSAMVGADLDYASWDFVMSDDWDTATDPQIRVSSGITVDEDGLIHIPLTDTNTEELIAALGTAESVTLGCELCGFATGETPPSFVLQWDISVRNRRSDSGTGTPTTVPDGSYNAAQVDALLDAKENTSNKVTTIDSTTPSETEYPSESAVVAELNKKIDKTIAISEESTSDTLTVDPNKITNWTCNGVTNTITGSPLSTGYATSRAFVTLPSGAALTAGSGATMDDTPTADAINLLEIIWYNGLIRIRVLDHWAIPA